MVMWTCKHMMVLLH